MLFVQRNSLRMTRPYSVRVDQNEQNLNGKDQLFNVIGIRCKTEIKDRELVLFRTPDLHIQRSLSFVWLKDSGQNPLKYFVISQLNVCSEQNKKRLITFAINLIVW